MLTTAPSTIRKGKKAQEHSEILKYKGERLPKCTRRGLSSKSNLNTGDGGMEDSAKFNTGRVAQCRIPKLWRPCRNPIFGTDLRRVCLSYCEWIAACFIRSVPVCCDHRGEGKVCRGFLRYEVAQLEFERPTSVTRNDGGFAC
jgi:hypothetical protein